jgi:DNA repair photolyase
VVSFTITAADDALSKQVEPGAPPSSARFRAMAALAEHGIQSGVLLMPVLPFIEDTPENVTEIIRRAKDAGATHVVAAFGMTLRDRQRAYYYEQLDRRFPGLRERYERAFGERYHAATAGERRLETLVAQLTDRLGLQRRVAPYRPAEVEQLALFQIEDHEKPIGR